MSKLPFSEKEIKIQMALGILPPEMQIDICRYKTPQISKGTRKCFICGEKCIKKGDEFYYVRGSTKSWNKYCENINICMDCSWLSHRKINRMIQEGERAAKKKNPNITP